MLGKAVSCPISVVKGDCVQGGGDTNYVQIDISILWLPMALSGKPIYYLSVRLYTSKNDTFTSKK